MNFKNLFTILKNELIFLCLPILFAGVMTAALYGMLCLKYFFILSSQFQNLGNYFKVYISHGNIFGDFITTIVEKEILKNVLLFFCAALFFQFLHLVSGILCGMIIPKINHKLKKAAFEHILRLPISSFKNSNPGEIEKVITNFAESFCQLIEFAFYALNKISLVTVFALECIGIKYVFLVVFMWIICIGQLGYWFFRKMNEKCEERNGFQNYQSGFMCEALDNILAYKLFKCKGFLMTKFDLNQKNENDAHKTMTNYFGYIKFWYGMANITFFCFALIIIVYFKYSHPEIDLSFFALKFLNILFSAWEVMLILLPAIYTVGKFNKSFEFLNQSNLFEQERTENINGFQSLEIKNLNFAYRKMPIFQNFSMVCKDELLVIDGESGVGKSTLLELIANVENTPKNTIFINDKDISLIGNLYENISFLSQKDLIFDDTIKKNITLGKSYDEDKLKMILDIAVINDDLLMEFETKLCGPSGFQVSGGQAKRICIARMLLHDKDNSLIILDEPFNNLSQNVIDSVLNYLKTLKTCKTIIGIDHTGNLQKIADRIIVIEKNNLSKCY